MKADRLSFLGGVLVLTLAWGVLPMWRPKHATGDDRPGANGYRRVVADWLWLQTNLAWEQHDAERVKRLIRYTLWADPQTPYFWQNSARMLAYDLPAWRSEVALTAPAAVQEQWRHEGAEEALALLQQGQAWHGCSAVLATEMGGIALYGLGDRRRAAQYFGAAARQVDAPDYAARLAFQLAGPVE